MSENNREVLVYLTCFFVRLVLAFAALPWVSSFLFYNAGYAACYFYPKSDYCIAETKSR